jgi:hypothetical protein
MDSLPSKRETIEKFQIRTRPNTTNSRKIGGNLVHTSSTSLFCNNSTSLLLESHHSTPLARTPVSIDFLDSYSFQR